MSEATQPLANRVPRSWRMLAVLLPTLVACGSSELKENHPDSTPLTGAFVAVERGDTGRITSALSGQPEFVPLGRALDAQQRGNSFYLAIRKDQLGERFFLSSFLRQFYPEPNVDDAPLSTRVVSFELQNDQIIVFDREDRHHFSGTYKPEIIIDSFPVVRDFGPFTRLPGFDDYVLFDPAAGRNEFSALGTIRAHGATLQDTGKPLKVHSAFLQAFRTIEDGITFEKVFGGTAESEGKLENYGGTLGIALRRYVESPGFTRTPTAPGLHYFVSLPHRVPNTGEQQYFAKKWHIYKGMKPIEWIVSSELAEVQKQPEYAPFDLYFAVKRGIEGWNKAFGFEAFSVRMARPGENEAQDDKNFIVISRNPNQGYGIALVRDNPNTGEVRGATLNLGTGYLDSLLEWVTAVNAPPSNPPAEANGAAKLAKTPASPEDDERRTVALTWNGQAHASLCQRTAPDADLARLARAAAEETGPNGGGAQPRLTPKEQMENLVTALVLHEVGHTLGLRHNFKGSLTQPPSSTMDYLLQQQDMLLYEPGTYDVAAVQYLYGLSDKPPEQPFCTDHQTREDPSCQRYDIGTDPLNGYHLKMLARVKEAFLGGEDAAGRQIRGIFNGVKMYLLSAEGEEAVRIYNAAFDGTRPKLTAELLASRADYGERADALHDYFLYLLYGGEEKASLHDPQLGYEVLTDLGAVAENDDGARSFESRRSAVDLLKKLQTNEAHAVLQMASASVSTQRAAARGEEVGLLEDLHARIQKALTPYFD